MGKIALQCGNPIFATRRRRFCLPVIALVAMLLHSVAVTQLVRAQARPLPGELTADEAARELANPNTPLASLTLKNQYRWYKGKLPGAEDQDNYTMLFQPVFPFPVSDIDTIFFRPAIPLLVEQPVFKNGSFGNKTGLGDIGFDLAYGRTEKSGLLWAGGLVSTVPTATSSELAGKHWSLGPELFVGLFKSWGVVGIFPNHQWDVAGWGKGHVSVSQIQAFAAFLPGDGWSVGSSPIMNYNWVSGEWTIPVQVQVSKTVKIGSTPWKFQFEVNHYVQRPDAFGPKWMIGFNVDFCDLRSCFGTYCLVLDGTGEL